MNVWQRTAADLARELDTNVANGLGPADAARRLDRDGPNQLAAAPGPSAWSLFLGQFRSLLIWVLIGAALISGLLGEWVDALAIVAIVILNAVLGFVQEYRAEKSLAALKKLASPTCRVVRGGHLQTIASAELVAGDLIELEAGDHVPADARMASHTSNFQVQESSLTGESTPVAKSEAPIAADDLPLGDRRNVVYMGTAVVSGRARAIVVGTGMRTELGRIAGLIQEIQAEPTPLQKKLDAFGRTIVKVCGVLVLIVFAIQWFRGGRFIEVFLTSVSLAVAAIPEGLPAVVTIALALGVHRMVRRNALIRKLPSVETLGCATVICSDKTGTLTRNEMTVRRLSAGDAACEVTGVGYAPEGRFERGGQAVPPRDDADLDLALRCGALCNNARLRPRDGAWQIVGDPTEGALLTAAAKAGLSRDELDAAHPLVDEAPFDSERKMMSVLRAMPDGRRRLFVKGAPDLLLSRCTRIAQGGRVRPLTEADRAAVLARNTQWADDALRVLGFAIRDAEASEGDSAGALEHDLTFAGLAAMIDPPRDEAREAIARCRRAGIRVVMITGDHRNTAVAIGRDLGLVGPGDEALTGSELDALAPEAFEGRLERIPVYARVAPEHKLRIVRAWRRRGEIVAMTGDGVNDAPAVKEADIGVAMGITGTDVTKEVSDMVVTDDNFASIVAAVEEGRGIYDNILKSVQYLLSCNAGEILVMFLASLAGMPIPLLPIQILWINLVTDGLPALALGVDPVDPDIMARPPRNPSEPVISGRRGILLVVQGFFIAFTTLGVFAYLRYVDRTTVEVARTGAFMTLSCSELIRAFSSRSWTVSVFRLGLFSNRALVGAFAVSMALQLLTLTPWLSRVFKVERLSASEWAVLAVAATIPFWALEVGKAILRYREARAPRAA